MINKTAQLLLKYIVEKKSYNIKDKDLAYNLSKQEAREIWDKYPERAIKRALNEKACTSLSKLKELCAAHTELINKG